MVTYVTGNYGKYISVKEKFEKYNIDINYYKCDIDELNINDIEKISKDKARQAYLKLNSTVFVVDSGFYIRSYPNNPNYPGAFVKRSGVANNVEELLNVMKNVKDRYCFFLDCLTYYDGLNYYTFFGKSEGTLSYKVTGNDLIQAKSNLWKVFIPKNYTKTLAQMTEDERKNRGEIGATEKFINWYKENLNAKNLVLKKNI